MPSPPWYQQGDAMDVRCEQCQTVYELDNARLKPGGVTVKCTQCQHIFRVGGASGRAGATGPIALATGNGEAPRDGSGPRQRAARTTNLGLGASGPKQWVVRLVNGTTQSCAELSILQEWIVTGKATREAFISRNEQTWKRLGDIPELAPYFVIAEEIKSGAAPLPDRVRADSRPSGRAASESMDTLDRKRPETAVPQAVGGQATNRVYGVPVAAGAEATRAARPSRVSVPPPVPVRAASMPPVTAGPQGSSGAPGPSKDPGFSGRARLGAATNEPREAAFVRRDAARSEPPPDYLPGYARGSDSRAGKWIALVAILVIAGSGFVVARMLGFGSDVPPHVVSTPIAPDAGPTDGGVMAPEAAMALAAQNQASEVARHEAMLGRDAGGELEAAAAQLAAASEGAQTNVLPAAVRSGLQARLLVALAQQQFDLEALADDADKASLRDKAQGTLIKAVAAAQRALKDGPNPHGSLAMAAIARLQKKPAREVERYLAAVVEPTMANELAYERAMLGMRDGAVVAAKAALSGLEAQGASARGDVRPLLRQAVAAALAGDAALAAKHAATVQLAVPDHQVAKRIAQKLQVASPAGDATGATAATNDPSVATALPGVGEETYDRVLSRAERAAESDCRTAMPLYQKALAMRPTSVEALTGAGYCHLAASEYASAHARFNQSLAISRRFEPALRGVAEAYAQQGRDGEAIAAYKKYLEVYPGSVIAKRQLERLTGGVQAPAPDVKPEPAPEPKPDPKPASTQDPAGSTAPVAPTEPSKPPGDGPVAMPD